MPEPLPTEIRVRVRAAGVNPVDWKTRAGKGMAAVLGGLPFVLGWDVAGVVEAVGRGVTRFTTGDRVYGMPWFPREAGGYGTYVTAPSRHFAVPPAGLDHVHAAGLPLAGLTAWQALVDTAHVQPGQRVLVHAAAGGVGHLAVQIAKALGAYVLGTASAGKHAVLGELGVDEAIDYRSVDFAAVVKDVDLVLDLVGGEYALRSIPTLRPGGLLISAPSGMPVEALTAAEAVGARATGILVEPDYAGLDSLTRLVDEGSLRPIVAETFDLSDAGKAHETGEAGRTTGKLVLTVA